MALEALTLSRNAGISTVEARILAVLAFSFTYSEDPSAGSATMAEAMLVAESSGEPEAIGEAHLRMAELLAGPLSKFDEGIEFARASVERMTSLGIEHTAGAALLTYAANALFRVGRWDDAKRAVDEAWASCPSGAAALEVRMARCRIDLGQGRLDEAASDLEAVELLADATTGPRHRIPLLVLYSALELWRRQPDSAMQYVDDGLTQVEAGADDIWAVAPLLWHGTRAGADLSTSGSARLSPAQLNRLRYHCMGLVRRGATTAPAVRPLIEAFSLMCAAEFNAGKLET